MRQVAIQEASRLGVGQTSAAILFRRSGSQYLAARAEQLTEHDVNIYNIESKIGFARLGVSKAANASGFVGWLRAVFN